MLVPLKELTYMHSINKCIFTFNNLEEKKFGQFKI